MLVLRTEIFDLYDTGNTVDAIWKETATKIGSIPYSETVQRLVAIGEASVERVNDAIMVAVNVWIAVDAYIIEHEMPLTKESVTKAFLAISGASEPSDVPLITKEEEDDHIQFEYEH